MMTYNAKGTTAGFAAPLGEQPLSDTQDAAASFRRELQRLRHSFSDTQSGAAGLQRSLSRGLRQALDGAVRNGEQFSDVIGHIRKSLIDATFNAAVKPLTAHLASSLVNNAQSVLGAFSPISGGAGFTNTRVMPFADGGIVSSPTYFPMRGGLGLAGEAGPEAILPLARGKDGRLGIKGQGGFSAPVHVSIHVTTPDVEGFRRTQSQISAQIGQVISRAQRNR